jgi:hypothetical protein
MLLILGRLPGLAQVQPQAALAERNILVLPSFVWTVPLELAINKVQKFGRLPVKLGLAGQYMVHHPKPFGQEYNIQLTVTLVLPKLTKGNLLGN